MCEQRRLISFVIPCMFYQPVSCTVLSFYTLLLLSLLPSFNQYLCSSLCISFLLNFCLSLSFSLGRPHSSLHKHICDNTPHSPSNTSTEAHKGEKKEKRTKEHFRDFVPCLNKLAAAKYSVLLRLYKYILKVKGR